MQSASHGTGPADTLDVSAANGGTGLGAVIGGLVIPQWGPGSTG